MFCHDSSKSSVIADNKSSANNNESNNTVAGQETKKLTMTQKIFRATGLGAIALVAPHAVCVGAGILATAGIGVTAFCWHHDKEADSSQGITELKRLSEVPANHNKFPSDRAEAAWRALVTVEPRFQTIFDAKQKEAGLEPVKVVFLEDLDTGNAVCVICKNGEFCPCSKPQSWEMGNKELIHLNEIPAQVKVLQALYQEK
jgi:hypothetical protein